MRKPELEFDEPLAGWQKTNGDAEHGIWEQILAADPLSGDSTLLQRYEPGADTIAGGVIVHDYWEEVMLLSGELTDVTLGKTFSAGMYACRPPGMRHGPYVSGAGCSMLVVVRPSPEPGANGHLGP
ncbi:cupin domain-containing protein [Pseudarthrobacter sp. RMG13]|uniref:Cupin domain-containing protein n=1 Tax=Pseudarthrobacter humi TaxID=2952523 RepID=A0ABT1LSV4_9MICC|nr:cupin domain-containing protein [Pseudarthrobacter humi]MCP9001539.1 cupin domain-containing protein [Pseudarthrobacter humi]